MSFPMKAIASDLGFIEGPVSLPGGRVLVCDLASGWVVAVDAVSGCVTRYANTRGSPNGLAIGPDGLVYVCNSGGVPFSRQADGLLAPEHGGALPPHAIAPCIQRIEIDGSVTVLYDSCDGRSLLWPNDLVFDRWGNIYFTDTGREQGRVCDLGAVYVARSDGSEIAELIRDPSLFSPPSQPNGIGFSPDGKQLYVSETFFGRLWSWDLPASERDTVLANLRPASNATFVYGAGGLTVADSLAVESNGFVCLCTPLKGGVCIIDPRGGLKDFVAIPSDLFITNICFDVTDRRIAYVTGAGEGKLWQIEWPRMGHPLYFESFAGSSTSPSDN